MKRKMFSILTLLTLAAFSAACAGQATVDDAGAEPAVSSHGEPVEDYVSLVDALRAANATVEPGDVIEQPFFSVKGQIVKVNGADAQVFEYDSAAAMEAEAALVAPDGGSIGTSMVSWMATPHFFKSGRVLVLYVGEEAVILDLMKSVLGEQFAGR